MTTTVSDIQIVVMDSTLRDALQLQRDEFECVRSMFLDPTELTFDAAVVDAYDAFLAVSNPHPADLPPTHLEYTIRYVHNAVYGNVPELTITYPRAYPLAASVTFVARCASLPRASMEALQTELRGLTSSQGDVVVLQLYQCMADRLHDAMATQTQETNTNPLPVSAPQLLGRRAIYFHHIIASSKRRVIVDAARELRLGGLSKIGWPGVVIVEGDERDVQAFVRRLQHLRWKHMVVRGEQTEPVGDRALDELRRLPLAFQEFGETAMAEAAARCRDAGLDDLFLSVMKIYRSE